MGKSQYHSSIPGLVHQPLVTEGLVCRNLKPCFVDQAEYDHLVMISWTLLAFWLLTDIKWRFDALGPRDQAWGATDWCDSVIVGRRVAYVLLDGDIDSHFGSLMMSCTATTHLYDILVESETSHTVITVRGN